MPKLLRQTRKLSPFFLFLFPLLLTLLLSLPWVNAKEAPKPKPQGWQIDGIVAALDDSQDNVKGYAFEQLAKYEPQDLKSVLKKPEDIARKAADILKNDKVDANVRHSAASALGNLGQAAQPYIKDIADILKDDKVDASVRDSAAQALGNLGQAAQPYIKDIADILKNEKVYASVRGSAAEALGSLGQAAQPYIKDILNFLQDDKVNADVRRMAAEALGSLGQAAQPYIKDILNFLKDDKVNADVRGYAALALSNIRKLELNEVIVFLNRVYEPNQQHINFGFELWRFLSYFLSGGTDEVKTLLKWVGNPKGLPTQLTYEQGKKTLEVFRDAWTASQGLQQLQQDLANKIADVARMVSLKPQDIPLLEIHYNNLKKGGYNQADTVQSVINDIAH